MYKRIIFILLFANFIFINLTIAQSNTVQRTSSAAIDDQTLSATVKSINLKAKTMILLIDGKEILANAPRLKKWPVVGSKISLDANNKTRRPYVYESCEACNAECPGVCFMLSDLRCRCYLLHL